jgi:hypothetical protein
MRSTLKWLAGSFISCGSLVALFDWCSRWAWGEGLIASHPSLRRIAGNPLLPFACLLIGFGFLYLERRLKLPQLACRFLRIRLYPRVGLVGLQMMDEIMQKVVKKENYGYDSDLLIELAVVNESDTPVTLEDFEVELFHVKEVIPTQLVDDLSTFRLDFEEKEKKGGHAIIKNRREILSNLKAELKGEALTKGIGHRGWVRFEVLNFDRKKMETAKVKLWVIDAFGIKHKVLLRKKQKLDESGSLINLKDLDLNA